MATSLIDLNNLNGNNGFNIPGITEDDRLGTKVDLAGDINGDGIDDLVISSIDGGNPSTSPYSYVTSDRRGETYVIFGKRNGFSPSFNLDNLDGGNGYQVLGVSPDDNLGSAVAVGDINGDGIDDLALGAPYGGGRITNYDLEYSVASGRAYVIFGKSNGFDRNVNVNTLDGNNGFTMGGIDFQDNLGSAIAYIGDINGDGIGDLAVSAEGAGRTITNGNDYSYSDRRGETYVIFGRENFDANLNLADLNGSDGFKIEGKDASDRLGYDLSSAGDINGDGIDDLIIGTPAAGEVLDSPYADGDSDRRGEAYVIFGRESFNSELNLNSLTGSNGFTIAGIQVEDNLGNAVSTGDINGDGIADLIIGAENASQSGEYTSEGGVYVIFGNGGSFNSNFDLDDLNGNNGFSIPGINIDDGLGNAIAAGDINGDGIDDLIIGAYTVGNAIEGFGGYSYSDRRGEIYVLYGKNTGFTAEIDLDNLDSQEGGNVAGLSDEDLFGNALSSGGDINGDGIEDWVASAPGVNVSGEYSQEGEVYVVFGQSNDTVSNSNTGTNLPDELTGSPGKDELSGLRGNDTIDGQNGDDTLRGNEGNDLLVGRVGNDVLFGDDGNDTLWGSQDNDILNGGNGNDLLRGDTGADLLFGDEDADELIGGEGNDTLNGDNGNDTLWGSINEDSLNGGNGEDLLYGQAGDDTLNGGNGNDRLNGNGGNDLLNGNSGDDSFSGGSGNDTLNGDSGNDNISGGDGNDNLSGGDGRDFLNGNGNADIIYGGKERDLLIGSKGNDTLYGGAGSDRINGNEDNDVIDGTFAQGFNNLGLNEKDTLIGGAGADIFTLGDAGVPYYDDAESVTKGIDDFARIKDFEVDRDIIKLGGRVEQYSLNFYRNGSGNFNAEIVYNRGDYLLGELIGVIENVPQDLEITDPLFSII